MKLIITILFVLSSLVSWSHYPEIVKVRSGFIEAVQHKEWRETYMFMLEDLNHSGNAHSQAYLGAAKTLVAETEMLPWTKYSYFKDGTRLLEEAIAAVPKNAEFRYLRFIIQLNAPSFLEYNADLKSDLSIIQLAIKNSKQQEVWMSYFSKFELEHKEKINSAIQTS